MCNGTTCYLNVLTLATLPVILWPIHAFTSSNMLGVTTTFFRVCMPAYWGYTYKVNACIAPVYTAWQLHMSGGLQVVSTTIICSYLVCTYNIWKRLIDLENADQESTLFFLSELSLSPLFNICFASHIIRENAGLDVITYQMEGNLLSGCTMNGSVLSVVLTE